MAKKRTTDTASREAVPPDVSNPPTDSDPKVQAEYFLELMDAFGKLGTSEAKRIRQTLIDIINDYGDAEDKLAAGEQLKARFAGLELGIADLLKRHVAKMRDRAVDASRTLGVSSPMGQTARRGAEGLELVVQALDELVKSARTGDIVLREHAHATLDKARASFETPR